MALFWLAFKTKRDTEIYIVEAAHLMMARIKASMAGQQGEFESGIQLDAEIAKKIPVEWIGKALSRASAQRLLKDIS